MTDPIVIEGLTKRFGSFMAVDSLTLTVKRNSFVGFLGPNGAGKTTTIKMLTNLLRANSGRALLNGIDVREDPKGAMSDVGAVVETPEFYPYLTPRESLEYLGRIRGMSKSEIADRTKEVLELVKMGDHVDMKIGKFSKGMKQRVAMAQALLHHPSLIILDEPTSGLDPRGRVEVRDVLLDLKKEDYTVFMSSHLLNEVQEICDSIAMMNFGRLVMHVDVDELTQMQGVVKISVRMVDDLPSTVVDDVAGLPRVQGVKAVANNRIVLEFDGDDAAKHELLMAIGGLGLRVASFNEAGSSLESFYMSHIGDSR